MSPAQTTAATAAVVGIERSKMRKPSTAAADDDDEEPATPSSTDNNHEEAPPSIPLPLSASASRRSSLDRDVIEGLMTMFPKKSRKKSLQKPFKRSKITTFYVVADARKPMLEIYNNETKSELVYLLSLAGGTLSFESDDDHVVMEKCFCVEVKTWKKKNAVHFQSQKFVFFEQDQAKMLIWVKCIHMAIKHAMVFASSSSPDDATSLFRSSMASSVSSSELDDNSVEESPLERPPSVQLPPPKKPPFNRLFSTSKLPAKSPSPRKLSDTGVATTKPSPIATAPPTQLKERTSLLSPKLLSMSKKSSSSASSSSSSTTKPLSDAAAMAVATSLCSPTNKVDSGRNATDPAFWTSETEVSHVADQKTKDQDPQSKPKPKPEELTPATEASQVTTALHRLVFLMAVALAAVCRISVFFPIAAAGVYAHLYHHSDEFQPAVIAAVVVYGASSIQSSLGLSVIFGILYLWSFAAFKNHRRRQRLEIADRLLEEEQQHNFAHVDIPNWIRHPDVDRVDWLNRVFTAGWPYLKLAIRNSLLWNLNPVLEAQKPTFMSSLSLVRVDLGTKTPHISGVKFVAANAHTDEVTLDIEVRIVTDKSFIAQLKMVTNVGATAVVSLRDLFVVGTLRVTLSPLCIDWPCFSALSLSFTTRPVLDFSLTAAKINIANVPFASDWLHTFLHDLLLDYFVWPKVYHIPLWEDSPHPPYDPTLS